MLTVAHPGIIQLIQTLSIGLLPISIKGESTPKLIVKTIKEMLLSAKINKGFKIYVVPIEFADQATIGLISAFFDDEDEPLVIFTPLFEDDMARNLIEVLRQSILDVHFFDEHDRELLGYTCQLASPAKAKERLTCVSLSEFDLELARSAQDQLQTWFGSRSDEEDLNAISVVFLDSLIPENLAILDARLDRHLYQGGPSFSFSQLEREEPGTFQEQDIAHLLRRLFSPNHIYMNPRRITDQEEIADLLVITESEIIILQAKDSPNTETVLKNTLHRKRLTTRKALFKAIKQVKGAIRYFRSMSPLLMLVQGKTVELDVSKHRFRALIIVKELFNDEYTVYSSPILKLSKEIQVPCITLDYAELQMYTGLSSEARFFEAFDVVFSHGTKTGKFPRLRIWSLGDEDHS